MTTLHHNTNTMALNSRQNPIPAFLSLLRRFPKPTGHYSLSKPPQISPHPIDDHPSDRDPRATLHPRRSCQTTNQPPPLPVPDSTMSITFNVLLHVSNFADMMADERESVAFSMCSEREHGGGFHVRWRSLQGADWVVGWVQGGWKVHER